MTLCAVTTMTQEHTAISTNGYDYFQKISEQAGGSDP
jgi:hypothetical protein